MLQVGYPYLNLEMLSDLNLPAGAGGGWAGAGCPRPSHLQEEETPPRLRAQETPRQVGTHALVVLHLMLNVLILLFSQEVPPPRPPAHLRVLWAQLWAGVWEGVRSLRGDNDILMMMMIMIMMMTRGRGDCPDRGQWPGRIRHRLQVRRSRPRHRPRPHRGGIRRQLRSARDNLDLVTAFLMLNTIDNIYSRRSGARGWVTADWSRQNCSN